MSLCYEQRSKCRNVDVWYVVYCGQISIHEETYNNLSFILITSLTKMSEAYHNCSFVDMQFCCGWYQFPKPLLLLVFFLEIKDTCSKKFRTLSKVTPSSLNGQCCKQPCKHDGCSCILECYFLNNIFFCYQQGYVWS